VVGSAASLNWPKLCAEAGAGKPGFEELGEAQGGLTGFVWSDGLVQKTLMGMHEKSPRGSVFPIGYPAAPPAETTSIASQIPD
jgi:hypothetical protein